MCADQNLGKEISAFGVQAQVFTPYPNREAHLGPIYISRALPARDRRMVGPWCFLDRFGPLVFTDEKPMKVPQHPHIGLQTVSWLLDGEILHTDSLGSEAILTPGGVNVMTAGNGIAHAEETPTNNSGSLSGIQLWVALPDEHRNTAPSFISVQKVPIIESNKAKVFLFAGNFEGEKISTGFFSDLLGMDVQILPRQSITITLNPRFEHALLVLEGNCCIEKQVLKQKFLYYLGIGRQRIEIGNQTSCRFLLIGGPPFPEKILMWWNFVARKPDEISQAREDWVSHRRFGMVKGTKLGRLSAPVLSNLAHPNPIS